MKNLIVLVLVMAALVFGGVAQATVQNMDGWFFIDVPDGWTVNKAVDVSFVSISSPDGTEAVTFEYASAEGMDSSLFASNNAVRLGGSGVVKTDNDDYEFTFVENGVNATARAFMIESIGVLMTTQGGFDNLYGIVGSFAR